MKSYKKTAMIIFVGLFLLIIAHPSSAIEVLTRNVYTTNAFGPQLQLKYQYYLDAAGQEVLHGERTQYYLQTDIYTMNQVSVIERYSHGIKHGLEEAWYQGNYQYTIQKHWEKEYQDGQQHGLSREWYRDSGWLESELTYRYGKLHGPARTYGNQFYPYNQTMEANYQDGLLHGHCKRWVLQFVSGYWTRYQLEEGDYAYGKKQGLWKTWCTSDSDPSNRSNPKNEGNYGNDVQCGRWTNYYCPNWLAAPTYTNYAACQGTLPPGFGNPLPPGGNKYEIRGHVTDRNTNLPLAGVTVQAGPGSGTSDAEGFYSVVLDSGGTLTLNAVKSPGYYDFSRTVNLTNTQYLDVAIAMQPVEAGGKPVVTNVDAKGGDFFIAGLSANNEYVVSVNWNGGNPGIVRFEINGTPYEQAASSSGASRTFDMGTAFRGSFSLTGNELKITAVNEAGLASRPFTLHPVVIPLPSWSMKMGDFEIKQDGSHLVYYLDTRWPEKSINIIVDQPHLGPTLWTLWGFVPYIGGRNFGIPDTQAFLTIEAKTDGSGSVAAGGISGFDAAGGRIEIKLGGKGNLKYIPDLGLELKTSLILGINGSILQTVGPVTLIPALEGAVNLPVIGSAIGWFNKKAQIKGITSVGAETELEVLSATGDIGFNRADISTDAFMSLGLEVDVMEGFKAEVKGTGYGKLSWQVPAAPDYFKQLDAELTGSMTLKFLSYEWKESYKFPYTYPEAAAPRAMRTTQSLPELKPLSRDFLDHGPYNVPVQGGVPLGQRQAMDTGGAGANTEDMIVQNVFPYSEPAIAVQSTTARGTTAIAYVYLDPAKPVHQETDIYFTILTSYNNGTYYEATTPAPIKSDTRAEFAPTIAYDANGKIVCVWQRVKNLDFPSSGSLADMAADMEIVYSVYNGTAWSEPMALTDNAYMDYNPVLKRGANGNLMLVWFSNEGNLLVGNDTHPTTVHYALWNKTTASFGTPATLPQTFANCFKFSLAYSGTAATLAYMKDMDGNLTTANDQEIFYVTYNGTSWGAPVRVTSDDTPDANPQVVYRKNVAELVWLRDNAIVRLTALSPLTVETIQGNVTAAGLIGFSLYTDSDGSTDGRLVLLRQDSDGKGVDLFYSVYDNLKSAWGNILRLTESPAMETDVRAVFGWPNLYHLVFNRKNMTTGATDLYHKTFTLATDLAVTTSDLSVEPANPVPGDAVTLRCRVTNRGDLAVANPKVTFRLGSASGTILPGGTSVSLVPATLKAGEVGEATLAWTIPADPSQSKIYAVVSAAGVTELSTANNTASFDVIKADLKAVRCLLERRPDGSTAVRAEIRNDGLKAVENVAVLFKAQDAVIGTMTIPGILPGKSAEVVYPAILDHYSYTTFSPRISVTADPDNLIQEINEDNNTASFIYSLEAVSPVVQDFGQVHYRGAIKTEAIFNKMTTGLAIGSITIAGSNAGDFRIFDDPCSGKTIQAQNSCLVAIAFQPTSLGVRNAELLIRDSLGKILSSVPLTGQLDYLIPGDVNDDGVVSLPDVILALQVIAGLHPAGLNPVVDVNGEGKIGLADAIFILQKVAGIR